MSESFKRISVMTDWGFEDFWICPTCSAIVEDVDYHSESHKTASPESVTKLTTQT